MQKETAEKCKFIAGLFFFGGKKADIIRSSNESRPKLRNEIKQQDKKIKSEDERMKKKVADLTEKEIEKICDKFFECSKECPLYRKK
mgnify:CR=1 FL=1